MIRFARRHPVWAGFLIIFIATVVSSAIPYEPVKTASGLIIAAVLFFWLVRWWRRRRASDLDKEFPDEDAPSQAPYVPPYAPTRSFAAPSLGDVLMLTAAQFEEMTRDLLTACGYQNLTRTGGAGDLGADVLGKDRQGRSVIVQCKRYAPGNQVGSPVVQSFIGMMTVQHRADRGVFVTSASFSLPAINLAKSHGVTLIDGSTLLTLMEITGVGCHANVPMPARVATIVQEHPVAAGPFSAALNGLSASPVNVARAPKYCTSCGASVDDGVVFCSDCGQKIKRTATA